jgi:NDP-sugar pyrophosphorylase family protein
MRAMVLAAGLGTRLRPLTNDRPKALVEVAGRTLLEITLTRLKSFGVEDVIVNTHHFAETVESYLAGQDNFGMRIAISHEDVLLDTGGGLKKAAWFLREAGSDSDEPFYLHNVDVLSNVDLAAMARFHAAQGALATLAVQARETLRPLLFDERGELCGRVLKDCEREMAREAERTEALAFAGIHVISPRIFDLLHEDGVFSIIPAYLQMAAAGETIEAYRADGAYWRDMGKPESIAAAERDMAARLISY